MKNWKIGTRLMAGFGVLIALLVGVGWLGLDRMSQMNDNLDAIAKKQWGKVRLAQDALALVNDNARITMEMFIVKDKASQDRLLEQQDENKRKITEAIEKIEAGLDQEKSKILFANVKEARAAYVESFQQARKLMADGKNDEAMDYVQKEFLQRRADHLKAWAAFVEQQGDLIDQAAANSAASYSAARTLVLVLIGIGFLFAAMISVFVTRSVTLPIAEVISVAEKIAQGDLRESIRVSRGDETGKLQSAMQQMWEKLGNVIGEVRAGASALSSASEQVSAAAQNLSQGTSEQAASVEETTSSLEQMNASISQNAENSRKMEQNAVKGARDAGDSGQAVKETVEAMKGIAQRISIIEEIAYQTNLLALNAAIEAARAGEHGKGFAVVATEVRKLAERSRTAAQEISNLAGSSVQVAERSGALLGELVPAIQKTAELVQEVAATSNEQASGVNQINRAMEQVEQVTQRNASAAEELSSTAEELSSQAEALQEMVSFFKLNGSVTPSAKFHHLQATISSPTPGKAAAAAAGAKVSGGAHASKSGNEQFVHF